ncbi:MAG: YfbM family protein [Alphaproteobacteria bacterium]|nr:YfbM family protein [Alphaproteobacteria bacterium]
MGVCLVIKRIPQDKLDDLLKNPKKMSAFVGMSYEKEPPKSWLDKLLVNVGLKKTAPVEVYQQEEWMKEAEETCMDFDKMWHVFHFLLAGTDDDTRRPQSSLLTERAIGDIDVGYGPARYLDSEEVKAFNEYVSKLDFQYLISGCDYEKMKALDIYFVGAFDPEDDSELEWLEEFFDEFKAFLSEAAAQRQAFVIEYCRCKIIYPLRFL